MSAAAEVFEAVWKEFSGRRGFGWRELRGDDPEVFDELRQATEQRISQALRLEGGTRPWVVKLLGDGLLMIREVGEDGVEGEAVLSDIPGGWGGGFGPFPHDQAIVEYLVRCRNRVEGAERKSHG